jgi:hypothetical protein
LVQPTTWLLLALALLAGSRAAAQLQPPVRQRQDRSATLPAPPAEPLLELYMAADSSTTVAFNGGLDRDPLVVDHTRFKRVDVMAAGPRPSSRMAAACPCATRSGTRRGS